MNSYLNRIFLVALMGVALPYFSAAQTESVKTEENLAEKKAALESVESWLTLIDATKYNKSWDAAAKLFQDNVAKADWKKSVEGVRAPLGKVVSRTMVAQRYLTKMPGAPDGQYVILQYATVFENKKEAMETVIPLVENGEWKVSGYHVK